MTGVRAALVGGAIVLALLVLSSPAAADVNLVVTDVTVDPSDPTADEDVRFPATVANEGDEASEPFTVRWILDNDRLHEEDVDPLDPGETITLTSRNWTATAGDHTIRVVADVFDQNPDESDETDNTLQVGFTVAQSDTARGPVEVLDARLPVPRHGARAAQVGDTIYVVGGVNGTDVTGNDPTEILAFHPGNQTLEATTLSLPRPLRAPAVVVDGDRIHVLGGEGPGGLRSEIVTVDPVAETVTTRDEALPQPRCCGGTAWNGSAAHLLGGLTPEGAADTIVVWTPGDGPATRNTTLPTPRHGADAAWDPRSIDRIGCPEGCAYLLGGVDASGTPLRPIVRYDPTDGSTERVSARLPSEGADEGAALWSGKYAYVLGGVDRDDASHVLRYDPVLEVVDERPVRFPTPRHAVAAAWHDAGAYVFGGDGEDGALDEIVRYEPGNPDLALRDLRLRPDDPTVGDDVRFRVTVENVGTVAAGNFSVRFSLDGDRISSADFTSLDVGRSTTVTSDRWSATAGPHTVLARAILHGTGSELQVDNNRLDRSFTVNEPPVPSFTANVSGLNVTVDASGSTDPDGSVTSYRWIWGDETTTTGGPNATHRYDASGNYTVILEVGDDRGATAQTSRQVTPNVPPVADFTATVSSRTVRVDASASTDPDGTPLVSYLWDWGDNTTLSKGLRTNHTYAEIGIYTITLNVRDALGADAVAEKEVEVWGPIPGPGPGSLTAALTAALLGARAARSREQGG